MDNIKLPYVPSITQTIQQRRYQMLVHSYIHYERDMSIISDSNFDRWAKELVRLQKYYPKESMEARYYEEFRTFEGSTGYDLPYMLPNIVKIGDQRIQHWRGNKHDY